MTIAPSTFFVDAFGDDAGHGPRRRHDDGKVDVIGNVTDARVARQIVNRRALRVDGKILPPKEVCLRLATMEWPTLVFSSVAPMTATLRGRKKTSSGGRRWIGDSGMCPETIVVPELMHPG